VRSVEGGRSDMRNVYIKSSGEMRNAIMTYEIMVAYFCGTSPSLAAVAFEFSPMKKVRR
jgi:hypothetical protein